MKNLEQEILIFDGAKKVNCNKLLLFFHLTFVMLVSAFCTYQFRNLTRPESL